MFTGIVEEMGSVRACRQQGENFVLSIDADVVLEGTQLGDSIAVNGVCLTVTEFDTKGFVTGLAPETRKRTNLDKLTSGSPVNLERSVTPTTRMGGHFVQGHVDGKGTISKFEKDQDALWVTVSAPPEVMKYVVPKGYITLDGTSLTVVDVGDDFFTVTLVAYTQAHIILPSKSVGDKINIEVDVLGKYVERILQYNPNSVHDKASHAGSTLDRDFLKEHGYE